jgi:hypothetical protein
MPLLNSAVVIRFPDGDYEYDLSPSFSPAVGKTIKRKGAWWTITEMVESTPVTVYIAPASGQPDASPWDSPTGPLYRVVACSVARIPSTPIILLRFPDGDVEWRSTRGELPIGTLVRSRGALWRVRAYEGEAVLLEEASVEDQFRHGPVVKPSPLGDEPTLLETIIEVWRRDRPEA